MAKNYRAELVGVFGDPVDDNPTGVMEEAGFRAKGLNYRYITAKVLPEALGAAIAGARAIHMKGFNPVSYTHLDVYKRQLHGRALLLPAGGQARQAFRRACVVAGARPRLHLDAQEIHFLHHAADARLRKGAQADCGEDDDDEGDERGAHYQSTFPGSRAARRSRSPRVVCKKRLPRVSRQPR